MSASNYGSIAITVLSNSSNTTRQHLRIWFAALCGTHGFTQEGKGPDNHSPSAFLILIYGKFKQKQTVWQECQGKFHLSDLRNVKLLFLQTVYTNLTTAELSACISLIFNKIHFFLLVIKLPRDLLSTNVLQSILEGKSLSELPLKATG